MKKDKSTLMFAVFAGLTLCGFATTASAADTLLIGAGGGGGAGYCCGTPGAPGTVGTAGGAGGGTAGGAGGINGLGGSGGSYGSSDGGGGAGWLGSGGNGTGASTTAGSPDGAGIGGLSAPTFAGGLGGNTTPFAIGGFGGGGGGGWQGGGGGGGYSGGGGGSGVTAAGGGGGSYVDPSVSSVVMTGGANGSTTVAGDGVVATGLNGFINVNGTLFLYTGSSVDWTAPTSGDYAFVVDGAQGGQGDANYGGYGAEVTGNVFLTAGDELAFLVGGGGESGYCCGVSGGGGGGGSFVFEVASGPSNVPEPASLALVGLGLVGIANVRRRLLRPKPDAGVGA